MKHLVTYEKGEPVRWLGHLDILRTFERAIRRSGLPVAFSAGFNPRERLAFASALPVGVTGEREMMTIELTEDLSGEEVVRLLNGCLPPGIRLHEARPVPAEGSRDLLNSFDRAEYRVLCACPDSLSVEEVGEASRALLARREIPIAREREGRVRQVDIRRFIHSVEPRGREGGRMVLWMELAVSQEGAARPGEVVEALGIPGLAARRVHRIRLTSPQDRRADATAPAPVQPA